MTDFLMRIKRSLLLWPESATVHLFWRCHNQDFHIKNENIKDIYMKCLSDGLDYKNQKDFCQIHSFCVMNNHFHKAVTYKSGSSKLSKFMQYTHGLFGARFNRATGRSGPITNGRPKTPLVQNNDHAMRLQFYIESNPIRAGFRTISDLKDYIYSSYGYYAFGIKTKFTHLLTIPDWYIELGDTPSERQKKYQSLFLDYIENFESKSVGSFLKKAIGEPDWILKINQKIKSAIISITEILPDSLPPALSG